MRNRVIWLMAGLMIGFVASGPSQAQVTNLFQNGGFETGALTPWNAYGGDGQTVTATVVKDCTGATVAEGPVEGTYCLDVKVSGAGTNFWDGAVTPALLSTAGTFQSGKKYTLALFLKGKVGGEQINLKPELNQDPWTGYGETAVTMTNKWVEYHLTTPVMTADVTPAHVTFHVLYKAQEFWIDDVKWYVGDYVPTVVKSNRAGTSPVPDDKATDVPRDVTLSWKAGPYAATHNVYFGTAFTDVNTADATKPQLASQGQTGTSYKPVTVLDYGKTYYWRVDEVNAAPSNTVVKGNVWSFTVEPYSYPITTVTATASSTQAGMGAQNTVNGSGLDASGLHGTDGNTMWLSTGALPNWIQYQFDSVYKLDKMLVWNSNQLVESFLGFGAKDVKAEYSTDGTTWTALANVPPFAQAPGAAGYAANTTVDFGGALAQYVKLTINSTWGGMAITGLSEVQFFYAPVQARAPQPATNTQNVSVAPSLDWRPGRDVTSQKVYLGTDKTAVTNETVTATTLTDHGYTPGALNFGTVYYWKVDEIGAATYPGAVWKFTTQQYAVVDDFESYTDKTGNCIFDFWVDGWTNSTGSQVGYLQAPFAEQNTVHGGKQSMPFEYNNVKAPYYSEATRTFDTAQDWTANGADSLTLYFQGFPTGFIDKGNNAFTVASTGTDIWNSADQFRFVYKTLSGNGSITARVDDQTPSNAWAKAGVMIRESLDAGSKHVSIVVTPGNSCSQQYRTTTGAAAASTDWTGTAVKAPYWVRVTRTGNTFKTETSPDGKTWTSLGADQTVNMVANVYVGLCVTSHDGSLYTVANFSNVTTTGTGAWQNLSIGVTQNSNGVAPLYLTVEDKAGKKKTVVNPDASAVTQTTWTEWRIALSSFSGVNVAAVKNLTIGVGDNANPKPGAAGMLFIDDILFGKPILPVGLVANYTFENNVKDVTGNGHDGTIVGTPTYVTGAPNYGMGMLFPGPAGNMVSLGTFDPSEKTGMLSVSLWAKWNGLTTYWQGLIGKRNTWADGQTMWQIEANQTTGALSFSRYNITGATAPVLVVGTWTHIALTFDKTTAQFYINGAKAGAPSAGTFSFGPNTDAAVEIGNDDGGGGNPFNGALDEVRLYDYALTPAEILTLAGK